MLLVGTNKEAAQLAELLRDHPETGFRIVGVVGDRLEALGHDLIDLWKGEAADAPAILRGTPVSGVVVVVGALETEELNELVRELQARKIHMHLSNGVRGINYRRLRAAPIAHEPLFYVEQPELRRRQRVAKRVMDLAIAGVMMVVAASGHGRDRTDDQAQRQGAGVLQAGPGRPERRGVQGPQVPHHGRRRRGEAARTAADQRAQRPTVQDGP